MKQHKDISQDWRKRWRDGWSKGSCRASPGRWRSSGRVRCHIIASNYKPGKHRSPKQSNARSVHGAAVVITPNDTRVPDRWRFDHKTTQGVPCELSHMANPETLVTLLPTSLGPLEQYGNRCILIMNQTYTINSAASLLESRLTAESQVEFTSRGRKV